MNRRRLDMLANRIEAVCASHKITARVHGGTLSAHSAVFVMTFEPPSTAYKSEIDISDLAVMFEPGHCTRQLMAIKDDIELSLGQRVLIHHAPYVRIRVLGVQP